MFATFAAIFPVFILLILGNVARRSGFLDEAFWVQAEKGTYYVLFPALLISRLWQADFDWQAEVWLLLSGCLYTLIGAGLSILIQKLLRLPVNDFTSFFQGAIRFNTYIGLALIAVLPAPALTLAALVLAVLIPMVNVLSVMIYTLYSDAGMNWKRVGLSLLKNPLVVACVAGIGLNLLPWSPPVLVLDVLDKLGSMALPLGLLAVGAGLRLKALKIAGSAFFWSAIVKLLVLPVVALLLARLMGLGDVATSVLIIWAALPAASSSYILARQMGGNAELMAGMITGQTLLALVSLPALLAYVIPI